MKNPILFLKTSIVEPLQRKLAHRAAATSPVSQEMQEVARSCPKLERATEGYFPSTPEAIKKRINKLQARLNFADKYDLDLKSENSARIYKEISNEIAQLKDALGKLTVRKDFDATMESFNKLKNMMIKCPYEGRIIDKKLDKVMCV